MWMPKGLFLLFLNEDVLAKIISDMICLLTNKLNWRILHTLKSKLTFFNNRTKLRNHDFMWTNAINDLFTYTTSKVMWCIFCYYALMIEFKRATMPRRACWCYKMTRGSFLLHAPNPYHTRSFKKETSMLHLYFPSGSLVQLVEIERTIKKLTSLKG